MPAGRVSTQIDPGVNIRSLHLNEVRKNELFLVIIEAIRKWIRPRLGICHPAPSAQHAIVRR